MKKVSVLAAICALALIPSPRPALAQGIPVIDAQALQQQILSVINEGRMIAAQAQDYAEQIQQGIKLAQQVHALTGARNMGELMNGLMALEIRRYLPPELDGLLDLGGEAADTVLDAQRTYGRLYDDLQPIVGAVLDPSNPEGILAHANDRTTNTLLAVLTASEEAYNNVTDHIESVEVMMDRLNDVEDLKASSDLSARIEAEGALLQLEMIRLQTLQMQLQGATANEDMARLKQANTMNEYNSTVAASTIR